MTMGARKVNVAEERNNTSKHMTGGVHVREQT